MKKTDYKIKGSIYDIPVTEFMSDDGPIIIALHGFGGDRRSSVIERLAKECGNVICFDFPAHGDSEAPDSALTTENCIRDFAAVVSHVKCKYPTREVCYFATSFGGYVLLNSMDLIGGNEKIVLRAPAVKMGKTYREVIAELSENEILDLEYVICGFERKIKVSVDYYKSLKKFDAMKAPDRPMLIIHGDCDTVVLPSDISEFCEAHPNANLQIIEGADHRFKGKGQVKELVLLAKQWFGM